MLNIIHQPLSKNRGSNASLDIPSQRRPIMGRRKKSVRSKNRDGAALVEFAVVAPLMILFTLGLIDMGRMTMVKQLLINASREGARAATLPGATTASVRSDVLDMLESSGVTGSVTLNPTLLSDAAPGTNITVTVQAEANSVSWLGNSPFMSGKILRASTTMRRESL
ncbi:TadE/TadG family type IV pilus assembly protein [Pirellulaceae bacterium SH467]|jgi:Flp pilus assembly protein TadG